MSRYDQSLLAIAQASASAATEKYTKPRKQASAHEHHEQVQLVQYLELHHFWKTIAWYAVPNGGNRGKAEAGRFRAEGVRAGVPDLVFPFPNAGWHGLYLEMKAPAPHRYAVSSDQREMHDKLTCQGYAVVVARGCIPAIEVLESYRSTRLFSLDQSREGEGDRSWWLVRPASGGWKSPAPIEGTAQA